MTSQASTTSRRRALPTKRVQGLGAGRRRPLVVPAGRSRRPPGALHSQPLRRVLLYGSIGGVLIALLRYIEYQHFVRAYPTEIYGGILAVIFTAVGIYLGLRWTRPKEIVVVREVHVPGSGPFVLNTDNLKTLG